MDMGRAMSHCGKGEGRGARTCEYVYICMRVIYTYDFEKMIIILMKQQQAETCGVKRLKWLKR